MESSFRLFRFRGIDIGANWSWLLVFALLVFSLWQSFPRTYPDVSSSAALVMAFVAMVVFFASLLLHELGHALQALREGMEIDGITLWFFGGVARFKGMFPSAGAEFRIAIAGPLVTAVLIAVFAGVSALLNVVDAPAAVVGVADYLARINGVLLAFNLVPALPLDGGRVLRAYLWQRQRSFAAATTSAAKAGRAFGIVLIGIGVLGLFTGMGAQGLIPAFLGWFLMQAAQAEVSFAQFRQAMGGLRVRDLMTPDPELVTPATTIADFIEEVAHARGHSTYPVVYRRRLVGLVSLRLAARVPSAERLTTTVRDVMLPVENVPVVGPDEEVFDAVLKLQGGPGRAVVTDEKRVLGILSGSDIARAMEVERIRGPRDTEAAAGRTPWIVWVLIAALIVAAAGFLYYPPLIVIAPGKSFDVTGGIHIQGKRPSDVNGRYLLTSVSVQQPNGLQLALAVLQSRDIVPLDAVVPQGVDQDQYFEAQRSLFTETRSVAAAAAARAAGLEVGLRGTGARVVGVLEGSPAEEVLRAGDVITAIDARPVRLADEIGRAIRARPSGTRFVLTIERGGRPMDIEISSRAGVIEGRPGIGITVDTRDFRIDLPFRVRFDDLEIGGPSAGITYALAVYDLLVEDDIADGRDIASTGEIDLEGRVGPVGGVEEKAIAAERAGAELFLVPEEEVEQARGSGLPVQGIETLKEGIDFLRTYVRT
jgi:PDZ domain-containing secreted protein/Zn-dependent protease/CBS domain-containing protein